MAFIAADSYHSTIATIAGGTGVTSFTVTSASGFPALATGDYTVMRLDDAGTAEDVTCTAISGTTVTCLATTSAHAAGNTIDGAIQTTAALAQIKDDAHSGFPVNAFTAAGALVKGTGVRNHGTVTAAACTMTLANGTYTGELCRVSMDRTSTKQVTVDPAGATLWDGVSTIALFAGDNIIGAWDGTGWITLAKFSSAATSSQILVVGNWYWHSRAGSTSGPVGSSTVTHYVPYVAPDTFTVSDLGARVQTLAAAGNFKIGIYANGTNNQATAAVLASTGNLSTAATGIITGALGSNFQFTKGTAYWFAFQVDNATAVFNASNANVTELGFIMGASTVGDMTNNNTADIQWTATSTFGTFATSPTITEAANSAPARNLILFKVASVP